MWKVGYEILTTNARGDQPIGQACKPLLNERKPQDTTT